MSGDVEVAIDAARRSLVSLADARVTRTADAALLEVAGEELIRAGLFGELQMHLDNVGARRPDLPSTRLWAIVLANEGQFSEALSLLDNSERDDSLDIRAYLELELGNPHVAIKHLRSRLRSGFNTPQDHMNLAFAYWRVGSYAKAIKSAREAALLAPGRKDISLDSLRLMLGAGMVSEVLAEVRRLKTRGIDDPDLLRLEAEALDQMDRKPEAMRVLRRAGNHPAATESLRSEAELYSSVLGARLGLNARADVFVKVLDACRQSVSSNLVDWLVEMGDTKRDGEIVESLYDRIRHEFTRNYALRLESHIAFLKQDWETSLNRARELLERDEFNEFAIGNVAMLEGHLFERWEPAISLVRRMERKGLIAGRYMVNQSAFILASGGYGDEALKILGRASNLDPVMLATRGLARMAAGDFSGGARDYRDAFSAIPRGPRQAAMRGLMAVYEAQGMYRLGIVERQDPVEIQGNSLPVSELEGIDDSDSSVALLKESALRNGWPWPTLF
ncbi:hypothetical protein [Aeromicrobium sp. IC_218]|uniref:tetratricopeptide repeat protein n=1 Tax=Aeromicrobium sp. IC_218 TaxID=2545468 RepID=UPI0010392B5D|nr:hypothetical protein [Aeromicrobium sp. IC_218]TCJ00142.1 hypothetical protein E0W78_02810 [Aeromicrobium sp. IC_218]